MPKTAPHRADSFEAFLRTLEGGPPAPVYLVHGPETLLADRAVDAIARAVAAGDPSILDRESFQGEEADAREVALAAAAYPMLGGRRLVVLRDPEKLGDASALETYLRDPARTTVLVVVSARPDFRTKLFQALKESAVTVECRTPYDENVAGWIEAEVRAAGKAIDPDGAELLRSFAGSSLAAIAGELEKLYTYAGGRKAITADDVAAVVGVTRQATVFDLQRAIGARDVRAAVAIVSRMIESGESMARCIAQLAHYHEKLWLLPATGISRDEAAGLLGVRPFFAGEYLSARRNFTTAALENGLLALRDADLALKTSQGSARQVMTLLVHALTRG